MSIAREVVLRHRESGYLRFDLPEALCTPTAAETLSQELTIIEGVYRVALNRESRKLALRFHDDFCSFEKLIRSLLELVKQVADRAKSAVNSHSRVVVPIGTRRVLTQETTLYAKALSWLKSKGEEIRETFLALKILLSRSLEHRPRWVKEFMNDLLMLFLIKLHWHQILTEWLPRPWTYRYEWLATIYLIYLSVQSKIPQPAP